MNMKEWERIQEVAGKTMSEISKVWPNMTDLEPPYSFFLHEIYEHLGWNAFCEKFTNHLEKSLRVGEIPDLVMWLFEILAELPREHVMGSLEELLGTFLDGETTDSILKPLLESCEEKETGFCAELTGVVLGREKIQVARTKSEEESK